MKKEAENGGSINVQHRVYEATGVSLRSFKRVNEKKTIDQSSGQFHTPDN